MLQAGEEGGGGQVGHPGGGQLNRQRQPVQSADDLGDGRGVLVGEGEVGLDGLGALDEEADGVDPGQLLGQQRRIGQRQGRHGHDPLGREAQRLPAGGQDRDPGAGGQQPRDERGRLQEVLEVVQHQQQVPVPQSLCQPFGDRPVAGLPHAQRGGHRRRDEARVGQRRQVHEGGAVGDVGSDLLGDPDGQPRLTHPARAGQRDQPDAVSPEQVDGVRHLSVSADQRGQRDGQGRAGPLPMREGDQGDRFWAAIGGRRVGHGRVLQRSRHARHYHRDGAATRQPTAAVDPARPPVQLGHRMPALYRLHHRPHRLVGDAEVPRLRPQPLPLRPRRHLRPALWRDARPLGAGRAPPTAPSLARTQHQFWIEEGEEGRRHDVYLE